MITLEGDGVEVVLRDPSVEEEASALLARHRGLVARVAPWAERPRDPEAFGEVTRRFLHLYLDGTSIIALARAGGRLVGGLTATIDLYAGSADLGYWVIPPVEGRGVARRAVETLADHLVERRGVRRLTAGIAPGNARSLALAARLGMRHEATLRSALAFSDRREDVSVHAISADEWRARRPGGGPEMSLAVDDELELVLPEERFLTELADLTERNVARLAAFEPWAHDFDRAANAAWWRARLRAWADGEAMPMLVRDRRSGALLGSVGARIDPANASAEVGFWLDAEAVGRGVVSRCVRRLVDVLVGERGLVRIELRTSTQNVRARAVADRLGFTHEGTLRDALVTGHRVHDLDLFALLR